MKNMTAITILILVWSSAAFSANCITRATSLPTKSMAYKCEKALLDRNDWETTPHNFHCSTDNKKMYAKETFYPADYKVSCKTATGQLVELKDVFTENFHELGFSRRDRFYSGDIAKKFEVQRVYFEYEGRSYFSDLPLGKDILSLGEEFYKSGGSVFSSVLPKGTAFNREKIVVTGFDFRKAPANLKIGLDNSSAPKDVQCDYAKDPDLQNSALNIAGQSLHVRRVNCRDKNNLSFTNVVACPGANGLPSATDCFKGSKITSQTKTTEGKK